MSNYDNTNKISIFVNNREGRAENAPILTGYVNVEGTDYRVSLWAKQLSNGGATYWSGTIKKDEQRPVVNNLANNSNLPPSTILTPESKNVPVFEDDPYDDIPF